jgi:hypothetical protein
MYHIQIIKHISEYCYPGCEQQYEREMLLKGNEQNKDANR